MKKNFILLFLMISIQSFSQWSMGHFVDNFGDTLNKTYLRFYLEDNGKFSNSATSNSELSVIVMLQFVDVINNNDSLPFIVFKLYEYNRPPEVKLDDSEYATLLIKLPDGAVQEINLSKKLFIQPNYKKKRIDERSLFLNYLRGDVGEIKCYLVIKSRYGSESKYVFNIYTYGFNEKFQEFLNSNGG